MRLVLMSDTHGYHDSVAVPDGDVLMIAGDFTNRGESGEIASFARWLAALPHKHKLVIPGNHELGCEREPGRYLAFLSDCCEFLIDRATLIGGVLFYGSPWQPWFCDWEFNLQRGAPLREKWGRIPVGTQVLLLHGPVHGYLDVVKRGQHVGCEELRVVVENHLPDLQLVVSGHIHPAYGYYRDPRGRLFVNPATCDDRYRPVNPPIVVDLEGGRASIVVEDADQIGAG